MNIEQRMTKQPLPFVLLGQGRCVPSQKEGTVLLSEPLSVPSECTSPPSCSWWYGGVQSLTTSLLMSGTQLFGVHWQDYIFTTHCTRAWTHNTENLRHLISAVLAICDHINSPHTFEDPRGFLCRHKIEVLFGKSFILRLKWRLVDAYTFIYACAQANCDSVLQVLFRTANRNAIHYEILSVLMHKESNCSLLCARCTKKVAEPQEVSHFHLFVTVGLETLILDIICRYVYDLS